MEEAILIKVSCLICNIRSVPDSIRWDAFVFIYCGKGIITIMIIPDGFYIDFGYGFYCTNFEKQAKR